MALLKEIADVQTGPFGSQLHKEDYVEVGTPIVTVEHLGNKIFSEQNLPMVSDEDRDRLVKYVLKAGDTVFSRVGSVDRCSYVDTDHDGWMFSGRCLRVRPNENVDPEYLYYFFTTEATKQLIRSIAVGATMPSINTKILSEVEVPLPSIDKQRNVAEVLSTIDAKIAVNDNINRNLSEQVQLRYSEYFEGEISKNWDVVPLSELIFFQEGPGIRNWQYVEADGTKFINIRCINNGDIDVSTANMISNEEAEGKYAHFMLKPYDIVMSCSGTLGRYAIVREEHLPLCLNTSVIRFSPAVAPTDFSFVYGYMTSKEFLNRQKGMACGSVQANFGPMHLKKIEIHEPPQKLRKEYHEAVFPIIHQMICLRRENDRLAKTRDSLLPKLISGELDVSELDI